MKKYLKVICYLLGLSYISGCSNKMIKHEAHMNSEQLNLPQFVNIHDENCPLEKQAQLRQECETVQFPLSDEVKEMLRLHEAKFDHTKNCAGLAAPQVGFPIKAIIFAVQADEEIKKWRPDLEQTMPKTIWLNPSYEPVTPELHSDYEACFSADKFACEVKRYKRIRYVAYDMNGQKITGEATGFLARVIQHEIDHVNGVLCIDRAVPGTVMNRQDYIDMRTNARKGNIERVVENDKTVIPQSKKVR